VMGVGGARRKKKSVQEGEGSVNTQTGSVRVAASQSNIVIAETPREESVTDASLGATTNASLGATTDASLGQEYIKSTMEGGGCVTTQTGSVRVAASQSNTIVAEDSLKESSSKQTDVSLVASLGDAEKTDASLGSSVDRASGVSDVGLGKKNNPSSDASLDTNISSEVTGASLDANTDASLGSSDMKSTVRGRGCVNTQTGSVRVAVSQSNTLIFGHAVESNFGQSGGRDSPESMDRNGQSEACESENNVSSKNVYTLSSATINETTSHQENVQGGPQSNKGGGGKTGSFASIFKGARNKKKGGGVTKPSLDRKYSTPSKNNHSFRGGNVGNYTPTKRKLISDNNIQNLISIFNTNTESKLSNEWDKSKVQRNVASGVHGVIDPNNSSVGGNFNITDSI
jgi:hypothetical protein